MPSNAGDTTSKELAPQSMLSLTIGTCSTSLQPRSSPGNKHIAQNTCPSSTWSSVSAPGNLVPNPMCSHLLGRLPKRGSSDYASINLQNLWPMFTNEKLALSLHTSTLWLPALRGSLIMDTKRLQADIVSSLQSDPIALEHLSSNADPRWTTSPSRLLRLDNHIYVPDSGDIRLHVLQYSQPSLSRTLRVRRKPSTRSDTGTPGWGSQSSSNTTASHAPSAPKLSHSIISLQATEAAPSTQEAVELDFHGFHREASPVLGLYLHPGYC